MITNPGVNVTYLAVTVVLAFGLLCFGLQSGLERITKYMMMLLLVLMLVLAVHSFTLSGAAEGCGSIWCRTCPKSTAAWWWGP